jgi:hypothetical protein
MDRERLIAVLSMREEPDGVLLIGVADKALAGVAIWLFSGVCAVLELASWL